MASGKAAGPDGVPIELYKEAPAEFTSVLQVLFNSILSQGRIPTDWSKSLIVPIYKRKGSLDNPNNYRPIALLNIILKIFTRILCRRLTHWVELNQILPEEQNGFRAQRSCEQHIFSFYSLATLTVSKPKGKLFTTFMDLEKAFDSVSWPILFSKLAFVGISNKFINILKAIYFSANCQVLARDGISEPLYLHKGILQGENLSPLLFSIYFYDLPSYLKDRAALGIRLNQNNYIHLLQYADDTILLADTPIQMQRLIDLTATYMDNHAVKCNTSSCSSICQKTN